MARTELVKDRHQVIPALLRIGIDINLLRCKGRPDQTGLIAPAVVGEWKAWARTIDASEFVFGYAFGKNTKQSQEHRGKGTVLAVLHDILELFRFPRDVVDDGVDHDFVGL